MANASGNGFERALAVFRARLSPEEDAQFQVTGIDDLRMAILSIQSHQRARKKMVHMKRVESFLEAMERFGKVIEIFLNATNYLAFVWGPIKLLLLTASAWVEIFDELLDAYQRITESLPIFEGFQTLFQTEPQMQSVLESVWSDILEFHSKALRIFSHSMLHTFFRSLWRDFRSRFQHILDDLAQHKILVESHANQIHIRDYAADRARIFQEFERVSTHTANEKYEYVLRWINAPSAVEFHEDLVAMRNDFFKATNVQTGQWIVHDEKVKGWLDLDVPKTSTLWIHGIPGAGKSVLASVVIDEIQSRAAVDHAFFYCKDSDSERSSYTQILRAFLSQLVSQTRGLVPYYYDEAIQSGEVSLKSKKLSEKLLDFALQNVDKGFVVIDGIDECSPSERRALLEHLIQLIDRCDVIFPGKVRFMVLSREEPDIKKLLAGSETLKITSRDILEDIRKYIKYQASRLESKFSELETEDIDYIAKCILDRTDGMFLFAKLVTENLIAQPTIHDLQREIQPQVFPNGLEQAQNNPREKERALANRILSMMLSARRPLRWHEVQCAISIDPIQQKADWARRLKFHVRDVCGSLIQILGEDRIEFVHATANFYIVNSGYISALSAAHSMSVLCLQYLSFECFDQHSSVTSRVASALQGDLAFQDYAVAHWCDHIVQLVDASSNQNISQITSNNEFSHAVEDFSSQFEEDLTTSQAMTHGTVPDAIAELPCSTILGALWRHSKTVQAQKDDRADIVSLSSLGVSLTQNRKAIEEAAMSSHSGQSKVQQLDTFYGKNLFKCPRRTCYFFHEGFDSSRRREDHNDHHERPFRCPEDDCPAQVFGFTSQKELDKHQKRIHPGTGNGPAKFARLKRAKTEGEGSTSFRCALCQQQFSRRYELRKHLRVEMRLKAAVEAGNTLLAPRPLSETSWMIATTRKGGVTQPDQKAS